MVAYKSSAVASFVKSPKADCRAMLVYGPDAGLVAERADALARVFARTRAGANRDRSPRRSRSRRGPGASRGRAADHSDVRRTERRPCRCRAEARCARAQDIARGGLRKHLDRGSGQSPSRLRLAQSVRERQNRCGASLLQRRARPLRTDRIRTRRSRSQHRSRDARLSDDAARRRPGLVARRGRQARALCARGRGRQPRRHRSHRRRRRRDGARKFRLCHERRRCEGGVVASFNVLSPRARTRARRCPRSAGISFSSIAWPRRSRAGAQPEEALRSLRPPPRPRRARRPSSSVAADGERRALARALPLIQEAIKRSRLSPDLEGAFAERLVLSLTSKV